MDPQSEAKEDDQHDGSVENPIKGEVEYEHEEKKSVKSDTDPSKNYESEFLTTKEWSDDSLKLDAWLIKGLKEEGFLNPSKIQAYAIPNILNDERKNMIAQSQNGSGKTLAFSIPTVMTAIEESKDL